MPSLIRDKKPPNPSSTGDWMARLRAALFEAVSEDDVREIAEKLVERAKEGDLQATRLLFGYILGGSGVKVQNAVIVNQNPGDDHRPLAPLPAPPTKALPNTPGRLEAYSERATNGQPLFDPRDRKAM
jgi:hypothetical protein